MAQNSYDDWLSQPWQISNEPGPPDEFGNPSIGAPVMVNPQTGAKIPYDAWQQMNNQKREEKRVADLRAQGLNPDSSPIRPEYKTLLEEGGLLKNIYQMKPELIDKAGLEGFQALKQRALGTGPSSWANLMLEKQKAEEATAKDSAARQAASSQAQAGSQLAMRGGLSSGARERLAMSGGRDLLSARQGVQSQGIGNRLGILTQDEQQRMALLPQFANAETGLAQYNTGLGNKAQEFNIQKALEETTMKRSQDMGAYQEQMKKWAAERQAQATEASAQKGK